MCRNDLVITVEDNSFMQGISSKNALQMAKRKSLISQQLLICTYITPFTFHIYIMNISGIDITKELILVFKVKAAKRTNLMTTKR